MALVWQGPKSRSALLSESLGKALGEGLGSFTGNYLANKELESIIADPKYKDKPLEEKWQAIQTRLAKFGGFGEKALKRQMEVDQTGYKMKKEREEKSQEKIRGSAFNKRLNKQPLTPEEEQSLTAEDNLAIAKHEQVLELQKIKGEQKKVNLETLGNYLTGQKPTTQPGNNITPGQPQPTKDQGEGRKLDPLNMSDEDILLLENQGVRGLRALKDAALKKEENKQKKELSQFQSDRDYHSKVSQPIIDAAQSVVTQAPIKRGLMAQQRRDIASGNTSGIIPFLVETTGIEAYRNPESARFKTINKQRFVETVNELGGANVRANQFIEQQLASAQPTLGRDKESGLSAIDLEEFIEDMKLKKAQIELKLAEEDREKYGYARNDIGMRAQKLMGDYAEKRQDEMAYDIRKRHEDELTDEQLVQEIIGKRVPPDTPLTLRAARILMIKNNDNEKKATAEAKKIGFKIPYESTYKR